MPAESITSTAPSSRTTASPGEGTRPEPDNRAPVGLPVTTPSTPALAEAGTAIYQLAVAHTWRRRGHPVVPCSRTSKRPLVEGWGSSATEAELAPFYDVRQVDAWWSSIHPRAHVGLLTRHVLVVDCDMPKGPSGLAGRWAGCQDGTDVLAARLAELGLAWPETYTVLTPSGGIHLYFVMPEDPIGCRTGTGRSKDPGGEPAAGHIGPLVDVRGVGGYVIAAGSYSPKAGRPYERISPAAVRPAPLPDALAELLRQRPAPPPTPAPSIPVTYGRRADRYAQAALAGAAQDVAEVEAGRGNALLFARARRLAELSSTAPRVLTLDEVERVLVPVVLGRPVHDPARRWTEAEARATIRSGWNTGLRGAAA
ncbi:bifunctional DNA primase/polymerase [Kitasatospora sp. NPDC057198]|uniref:bifunctional DNA primase/polymerase n=1 Tax=Kitasatospora sp. NPDC057198 TaxID=3346046 RepID=UPI0036407137